MAQYLLLTSTYWTILWVWMIGSRNSSVATLMVESVLLTPDSQF
jgi:hypothetical protein